MLPFFAGFYEGPSLAYKLGWLTRFRQKDMEVLRELAQGWRFYKFFFEGLKE